MSANRNQRTRKPYFRRDWMLEAVREDAGTGFGRFMAEQYQNERVRKGYNDAGDRQSRARRRFQP